MKNIPDAILFNATVVKEAGIEKCPYCRRWFKVVDGCGCGFNVQNIFKSYTKSTARILRS